MRPFVCLAIDLCLAVPVTTPLPAAELTGNLVCDGGMEEWRTTGPQDGWWNYLTVSWKAAELARDEKGNALTPKILSQMYDTRVLKPETRDVHGGQRALRLNGQFYLRPSSTDAFQTKEGDVYIVRYWVKGEGRSVMYLHVYGDARAQILETKGKPEKGRWSLIEERIQVVGRAPTTIYPRLWASSEMSIDDVSVARIIRDGERKLAEVPSDCQARVVFASETKDRITMDGKLDEPGWSKAVTFSGFRGHGDQTLLAAVQPRFRVLFDARTLYFGVEIPLTKARQVLGELRGQPLVDASGKSRPMTDTYTSRESVELFLQAPGQSRYCQFVVSLDGYRYDGAGEDRAWNGAWEFAVDVVDDRWFLEVKVPARDLGIEQVAPAEGWRLNLCCNQQCGNSTWAAVGPAFHNPGAFGRLIAQDFATWRGQQPRLLARKKAEILQAAGARGARYAGRLAAIDAAAITPAGKNDQLLDWEANTRAYSQMDFVGYAYRCVAEEVRYWRFFQ